MTPASTTPSVWGEAGVETIIFHFDGTDVTCEVEGESLGPAPTELAVTSISISGTSTGTQTVGDYVDWTGLTFTYGLSDGNSLTFQGNDGIYQEGQDLAVESGDGIGPDIKWIDTAETTVTVTIVPDGLYWQYNEIAVADPAPYTTFTFPTPVPTPTLESLSTSGSLSNTQYEGTAPDLTGLTVTAHYSDSTLDKTVTPTCSPAVYDQTGEQTLTLSYTDEYGTASATLTVTVAALGTLTAVRLVNAEDETLPGEFSVDYQYKNWAPDMTGNKLYADYDSGASIDITNDSGVTFSVENSGSYVSLPYWGKSSSGTSSAGQYSVKMTYDGVTSDAYSANYMAYCKAPMGETLLRVGKTDSSSSSNMIKLYDFANTDFLTAYPEFGAYLTDNPPKVNESVSDWFAGFDAYYADQTGEEPYYMLAGDESHSHEAGYGRITIVSPSRAYVSFASWFPVDIDKFADSATADLAERFIYEDLPSGLSSRNYPSGKAAVKYPITYGDGTATSYAYIGGIVGIDGTLASLAVSGTPAQQTTGQALDLTGLSFSATDTNGNPVTVNSGDLKFSSEALNPSNVWVSDAEPGTYTVTVYPYIPGYLGGDVSAQFMVTLAAPPTVTSVSITGTGDMSAQTAGDWPDYTGVTFTYGLSDGTSVVKQGNAGVYDDSRDVAIDSGADLDQDHKWVNPLPASSTLTVTVADGSGTWWDLNGYTVASPAPSTTVTFS